jgi:L-threonylcarbamoyladenylate synthase
VSQLKASATEVLPTHTAALFDAAVRRVADSLHAGNVVALPTETVYGLAANALDPEAVRRIFQIKGRPTHNPVIVHVASAAMARRCVREWPLAASQLAAAFWPGPMTLVLPRAADIPDVVTGGGDTVGVRWPGHPFIQAVIRECDFPLAAPSANPSNEVSPTKARHVLRSLGGKIGIIVDGGQSQIGIESTVVDLAGGTPRILRPGMIHLESLRAVLGVETMAGAEHAGASGMGQPLRSPGQLDKHYSPQAQLMVLSWRDDADLRAQVTAKSAQLSTTQVIAHSHIPSGAGIGGVSVIPHDAEAYGRAIYAELHRCDAEGASCIVVEELPEGPEWQAIADRLRRAAR